MYKTTEKKRLTNKKSREKIAKLKSEGQQNGGVTPKLIEPEIIEKSEKPEKLLEKPSPKLIEPEIIEKSEPEKPKGDSKRGFTPTFPDINLMVDVEEVISELLVEESKILENPQTIGLRDSAKNSITELLDKNAGEFMTDVYLKSASLTSGFFNKAISPFVGLRLDKFREKLDEKKVLIKSLFNRIYAKLSKESWKAKIVDRMVKNEPLYLSYIYGTTMAESIKLNVKIVEEKTFSEQKNSQESRILENRRFLPEKQPITIVKSEENMKHYSEELELM